MASTTPANPAPAPANPAPSAVTAPASVPPPVKKQPHEAEVLSLF